VRPWREEGEGSGVPWIRPSPHWLTTYSDMATLLLGMFIVLYAVVAVSRAQFAPLMASAARALGARVPAEPAAVSPEPVTWDLPQLDEVERALRQHLAGTGVSADVIREERGLVVRLADVVLFEKGSAELTAEGRRVLAGLGPFLAGIPNHVRVEGHTCDLPIHTDRYRSNWELSVARATSVVHVLLAEGVPPGRLSAAGYGEYRPVAPNVDEASRARNRRVDVVVLRLSLSEGEPR